MVYNPFVQVGLNRSSGKDSRMSMYWIYDFSNALLCVLIVAIFVGLALIGLFVTRPMVGWLVGRSPKHNDVVSFFFASMGVFYGLALGLIAVATWENYTEIDGVVSTEAAAVASFYRDLDGYPKPLRGRLEGMMREYTRIVIEKEWPAHKRGVALEDGDTVLDSLENAVMEFEPNTEREKIVHAEALRSLDTVVEQRRLEASGRLHGSTGGPLGGRTGRCGDQRTLDLSILGRESLAPRGPRRSLGRLHRALGVSDRGDGQPVSRRIQRLVGRVQDHSREGHDAEPSPGRWSLSR